MRHTKHIPFRLAPLLLTATSALAQTGDWQAVKNLPPGTRISVRPHRLFRDTCFFLSATDDQLVCGRLLHRHPRIMIVLPIPNEVVHERKRVREVRLEHGGTVNSLAGAGIGTALTAGANNGTVPRLTLGVLGAVFGASLGSEFPIIHGKVIYRR